MRVSFLLSLLSYATTVANATAEKPFKVIFDVSLAPGKTGSFEVEVRPEMAPLAASRFKELVE